MGGNRSGVGRGSDPRPTPNGCLDFHREEQRGSPSIDQQEDLLVLLQV